MNQWDKAAAAGLTAGSELTYLSGRKCWTRQDEEKRKDQESEARGGAAPLSTSV